MIELPMLNKALSTLAGKLIVGVGALMIAGSILFGFIFIRYEERIMVGNLVNYASSSADLVMRGIRHSMLEGDREAIEKTLSMFASGREMRGVTIFDKTGRIAYSSGRQTGGGTVSIDSVSCRICHNTAAKDIRTERGSKNWVITYNESGQGILKFAIPIENEPSCSSASCHRHPPDRKILGVLETDFSTATVDFTIRQNRIGTVLFGSLFLVMISLSLFVILYFFVSRPISLLNEGMNKLAKGELESPIPVQSEDELGRLAASFNAMAKDMKRYRENMENWTKALEEEVKKKTTDFIKAQDQLLNAEKLASLGRMAAGVAHELNSPLTGVVTFSHLLLKRIPSENTQDIEDLRIIIEQAERCSKIIKGLLGFSRKTSSEKAFTDINFLTESTISMLRNQAKFHNIKFVLNFDEALPPVEVDPNQIQQVFINLLINAADAVNERGQVTVTTRLISDAPGGKQHIEIEFTDNGPGIPEEHLGRIFEPFFTTKPVGKGTGLGLAVSYGIIKKHGGHIFVRSETGKGASFFVRLPADVSQASK